MSKVDEIKSAIESLPEGDYIRLRKWFSKRDWKKWDSKIKEDSKSGKLDFLVKEAFKEKENGKLRDL